GFGKVALARDIRFRTREQELGLVRRDLLGLGKALFALLVAALFGEEPRQIDQPACLVRSGVRGAAKLLLRAVELLPLFGEARLRPVSLDRIGCRDSRSHFGRLIVAATQKA